MRLLANSLIPASLTFVWNMRFGLIISKIMCMIFIHSLLGSFQHLSVFFISSLNLQVTFGFILTRITSIYGFWWHTNFLIFVQFEILFYFSVLKTFRDFDQITSFGIHKQTILAGNYLLIESKYITFWFNL